MMKKKTILLLNLFILISFVNLISAQATWTQFGNDYQPITQAQYSTFLGNINQSVASKNITTGIFLNNSNVPYQPLISQLGNPNSNYIIFPSGNFLYVYDNSLDLILEHFIGLQSLGQIAVTDFDDDGYTDDITGFWLENSTTLSFRSYAYNYSTETLTLSSQNNISYTNRTFGTNGVRCEGMECYSVIWDRENSSVNYSLIFVYYNISGVVARFLHDFVNMTLEPLSKQDINNDGMDEYLLFSHTDVLVFDKLGNTRFYKSYAYNERTYIEGVKFARTYNSPYWQLILSRYIYVPSGTEPDCNSLSSCTRMESYKLIDNSSFWNRTVAVGSTFLFFPAGLGFAIGDYDGDGFDDIYTASSMGFSMFNYSVIKGSTGGLLYHRNFSLEYNNLYPNSQTIIGRMDADSSYDIVTVTSDNIFVYSPATNSFLFNRTSIGGNSPRGCALGDLNLNGRLDIVCSSKSWTSVYYSNYTNLNPVINSVTYSPSTTIAKLNSVDVIINATDSDFDNIRYSAKCSDDLNWSSEDGSNLKSCFYSLSGNYNLTIRVRDSYHTDYNLFSQNILVTETGTVCGNDVCESGENNVNCPSDCPSNVTYIQLEGGNAIPSEIVNVDDINQGFLPTVYYAILGFFSYSLVPFLIIFISFVIALIVITMLGIVSKIFLKGFG